MAHSPHFAFRVGGTHPGRGGATVLRVYGLAMDPYPSPTRSLWDGMASCQCRLLGRKSRTGGWRWRRARGRRHHPSVSQYLQLVALVDR